MKTYKINGKEISEAYEGLHVSGDYLAGKINQLLEALSDKEEPKQSTSLKEDRNSLKYQVSYLLWNENNFTKEETDKYSEKILSLVKSHLVKEIEEQGKRVAPENYDIYQARQDIIKIINNIN